MNNIKCTISFDNQFAISDGTNTKEIKILMLKGEKGDKGDSMSTEWGKITGDITTQNDLVVYVSNAISSLGSVFNLVGSVANKSALPTENNKVGDVYYVKDESAGYVWLDDNGSTRWEMLGMAVDTSDLMNKNELLQTTGQTTTNAMSQKSVTDELSKKANSSDVYNKTEIDSKINTKANSTDVYTKTETDTKLDSKTNTSDLINLVYPVGSIYMSVNSTNPANLFGGTWTRIAKGRTLIGVDENNSNFNRAKKTGGSFAHNHTNPSTGSHVLTLNEMPDRLMARIKLTNSTDQINDNDYAPGVGWKNICLSDAVGSGNISQVGLGHNHTMGNTGTTTTIPQYFTCYIWQRTA